MENKSDKFGTLIDIDIRNMQLRRFANVWWIINTCIYYVRIDPFHKSQNASMPYPTMQHFVTEMCTCVLISVKKWCIMGYLCDALWDLWDGSIEIFLWRYDVFGWFCRMIPWRNDFIGISSSVSQLLPWRLMESKQTDVRMTCDQIIRFLQTQLIIHDCHNVTVAFC